MILFLAGSFPHLLSIEKEKGLMKKIEERKSEYHRLVSFYYPKTCSTVLTLKGERMGVVPTTAVQEKKLGKTNQDFLKAKETCEKVAACLKKKHDWILDLRFAGDISFKSNRKKASIKDAAEKGEEVSFGLNMIMTYLDEKGKKKETQVIIRHKPKPFYIVALKSYIPNPTRDDLVKQMENVWIYLLSGGTPEKPKAIALTRLDELPIECLTDYSKSQKGKFGIHFSKWVKYVPIGRNILGDDNETELFSKLRKG